MPIVACAFDRPQAAQGTVPRDILVLGAGMAGLTAALALMRRGHRVKVIECQKRVGGRLLSVPLQGGQYSEADGGHFRSNMPYVLGYVRHFKLPLLSLNDGLPRYFVDGRMADAARLSDWPWDLAPDERGVTISSTLNRYLLAHGLDTDTVLDARWPDPETLAALDLSTVEDLILAAGGSPDFCRLLDAHGGGFTKRGSALCAIPDLAYHFGDQNLFRIRGGNDLLPAAMARALGERIVLGARVVAIDQSGARAVVTVDDGRTFDGDAIVCTIPFTVLKEVAVAPAWSVRK